MKFVLNLSDLLVRRVKALVSSCGKGPSSPFGNGNVSDISDPLILVLFGRPYANLEFHAAAFCFWFTFGHVRIFACR